MPLLSNNMSDAKRWSVTFETIRSTRLRSWIFRGSCGAVVVEDDDPLSTQDQALINTAWRRHLEAAPREVIDPLAALSVAELRDIAKHLNVPRQVITAFRERRVVVASVPRRFLARFAAAVNSTVEVFNSNLASPLGPNLVRSYKADKKPGNGAPVTFERLLVDAGVPEATRTLLMADDD